MFRLEHLIKYFSILMVTLITVSEISLMLSDEQAEESKEERELKEEVKEKEGERKIVLLLANLDLASTTPFVYRFLSNSPHDYLLKQPRRLSNHVSMVVLFCSLKIPFC
ncbi:hypothetical protein [Ekhidna sp.]|uniref:hypothetical protein n=1 Tax=Ekhidna sp. TaxID=2608089 RepID=UPI003B510891